MDPLLDRGEDGVRIVTGVEFEPTAAMLEALDSGVDLRVDLVVRRSRQFGPVSIGHGERVYPITVRFLALTEQWQLSLGDDRQTFPRLWLLLDALQRPRSYASGLTPEQAERGRWRIEFRAVFNRGALPSPMHLPSLFSDDWRLRSQRHTWRIEAS